LRNENNSNSRQNRGQKRTFKDTRKMRQERRLKKISGQSYINTKGKLIPEKTLSPLTKCRKMCANLISFEKQKLTFENYRSIKDVSQRETYICSSINVTNKSTERRRLITSSKNREITAFYHIIIEGNRINICKQCFQKIFSITNKFLEVMIKKKKLML
jgi:hypothetical protein